MRAYTIPSIFTAIDRYSGPVNKMARATSSFIARSESGLARVERGFRSLMSPLTSLNKALAGLGIYIGLFTGVLLLRDAVEKIAAFEQAQVNISVVNGRTIQQNKVMALQARQLALTYGEAATSILDMDLALIKLFGDNSEQKVMNMSKAVLTASIALRGVPEEVGKTMGAIMLGFKIPDTQAQEIGDLLAKAADLSALDWSDLQTMLPIAMQSAAIAWKDIAPMDQFKRILALFAALRDAQVHVSTGATGVKNLLIDSGIYFGQGQEAYVKMLEKISKDPAKMLQITKKLLGRRTLVSALPLAEATKMGSIEDFIKKLDAATGYAERVAGQRMNSITGKFTLAKRAYDEFIYSTEDGTGPLAANLKLYLDTARAFFLMNAGSAIAKAELAKMDSETIELAKNWGKWFTIIKNVVIILVVAKIAILLWKAAVVVATTAIYAYNIAVGLSVALGWQSIFALRTGTVAMTTYKIATWAASAATWAMLTPILLTIAAIGLLTMGIIGLKAATQEYTSMPGLKAKPQLPGDEKKKPNAQLGFYNSPMGMIPYSYDANKFEPTNKLHDDIERKKKLLMLSNPSDSILNFNNIQNKATTPYDSTMMNELMMKYLSLDLPSQNEPIDNNATRHEVNNNTMQKTLNELIIKVQAQQGTNVDVVKKPQGIPVTYSSTNSFGNK